MLVPAFNNERTAAGVVRAVRAIHPHVFVVDDGSRDGTGAQLDALEGVVLLRHARNLGKGASLRTGLDEAFRRGFTHVVALDADGQHLPEDLARMIEAAAIRPDAMLLGGRDLVAAGAPLGSRLGCLNSNFWTWVETGLRLPDTQTGFRVYPKTVAALELRCDGFEFEIEVLVKAAWSGIPIVTVPIGVRYFSGTERVSHFRPLRDFLRIARLNLRLVALRLLAPPQVLGAFSSKAFAVGTRTARLRRVWTEIFVREPGSTGRVALSSGLGACVGLTPFYGFHLVLALLFAHRLGLSKSVAAAATNVSVPVLIPGIVYVSYRIGGAVLGRGAVNSPPDNPTSMDIVAWFVGGLLLGLAGGAVVGGLTFVIVGGLRRLDRFRAGS